MAISYATVDTPIGRLWLAATEQGLCLVGLPNESPDTLLAWLRRNVEPEPPLEDPTALVAAVTQLREYFSRLRRTFDVPFDQRGTPFQRSVWAEVVAISYGTVVTYGEIARRLGRGPGSARAVGAAVGANPIPIFIPCHRVVGADGSLVGYGGGLEVKGTLLRLEGVSR